MVLKSFDFFRKIQTEQELSSATGGLCTIISYIVAGFLIFLSIQDFTSVHYVTNLRVKNDITEYIPMKIDILFNKAPCELITIAFNDELEFEENGLEKKLNLFSIEGEQEAPYIRIEDPKEEIIKIKEGIEKNKQCRLEGTLNLPKTPGTLTFSFMGNNNAILGVEDEKRDRIRANYLLKKLEFGDALKPFELPVTHSSKIIESYIKQLEGDIAERRSIKDLRFENEKINYYNHLKIIPIFVDEGNEASETDKQKYRYSFRSGSAPTRDFTPILEIYTEIEPINIVYTKNNMTFYDLCVDILAIAGGSVATIGVLNALYHFLFKGK